MLRHVPKVEDGYLYPGTVVVVSGIKSQSGGRLYHPFTSYPYTHTSSPLSLSQSTLTAAQTYLVIPTRCQAPIGTHTSALRLISERHAVHRIGKSEHRVEADVIDTYLPPRLNRPPRSSNLYKSPTSLHKDPHRS